MIENNIQKKYKTTALFLTQGDRQLASSRFRVFQYIDDIDNQQLQGRVMELPPSGVIPRAHYLLKIIFAAHNYDVVFVQKILFPIIYLKLLRLLSRRLVYDWDDALYTNPPRIKISEQKQLRRIKQLNNILCLSDAVICGNDLLAQYSKKFSRNVHIIPTSIKIKKQFHHNNKIKKIINIGWIGRAENIEYLEKLESVFDALYLKYGNDIMLSVVCDKPLLINTKLLIINKEWNLKNEEKDIIDFDIGIMPLEDTPWARGKCAFKLLQYMAYGAACVGSPVGANMNVIRHGINGLLADNYDEWVGCLSKLIEEPEYRNALSKAGRSTVENNYSVNSNKYKLLEAIIGRT